MISRDKKLLFMGIGLGVAITAVFITVFFSRQAVTRAATPSHEAVLSNSTRETAEPAPVGTQPGTTVQLDPDEINAAGVQLVTVATARLKTSIDSVGRVEQPEAQLATIPARVGGRIDKLYIQFTGESVRRGQAV